MGARLGDFSGFFKELAVGALKSADAYFLMGIDIALEDHKRNIALRAYHIPFDSTVAKLYNQELGIDEGLVASGRQLNIAGALKECSVNARRGISVPGPQNRLVLNEPYNALDDWLQKGAILYAERCQSIPANDTMVELQAPDESTIYAVLRPAFFLGYRTLKGLIPSKPEKLAEPVPGQGLYTIQPGTGPEAQM